jgi:K+-transporting ATPase ATPase C chain
MIRTSIAVLLVLAGLTGIIYPLIVTGIAQVIFPIRANGSIIAQGGRPVGSSLIGQKFEDLRYFWGRPSATQPYFCNAASSSGSNLSQGNRDLLKRVQDRVSLLKANHQDSDKTIPVDLVTASGSGLDPHISPAAAEYQVRRVAAARGLDETVVRSLVARCTEGRQFGILGEPRVNILRLYIALDELN